MKKISLIAVGLAFAIAAVVGGTAVYAQTSDDTAKTEDKTEVCGECGKPEFSKGEMKNRGEKREHRQEKLAEFLGIEVAELEAKMEEFKENDVDKQEALEGLLTEYGKTLDQLKEFKLGEMKEKIAEKVAAGDINQEKADQILEKMEEKMARLDEPSAKRENFPGDGPHKGMGMKMGRR